MMYPDFPSSFENIYEHSSFISKHIWLDANSY